MAVDQFPSSHRSKPLHSKLLFERMGLDRVHVYADFARRAVTYGCKHSRADSTPHCKTFVKGSTAVLMFTGGIPSIRGRNRSSPSSDVSNELARFMAEAASRAGYPPG